MRIILGVFIILLGLGSALSAGPREARHERLSAVSDWFYHLGFELEGRGLRQLVQSPYDMLVIEPIFTEQENRDYPIAATIAALKAARPDRLVLAYIDIGQAEEWRYYWQPGWRIGSPGWIIADDPDGWEGNYPVAYWHPQWRNIWLDKNGQLAMLIDAGFDGVYLDWVEAYSDDNVIHAAARAGVDPRTAMVDFVRDIGNFGRARDPGFVVIAQNAAELAANSSYSRSIDGLAQEQVWYDGGSDNRPKGDCPLPATDADIETLAYINSLSRLCRQQHEDYPDSTLHVSSAEYIDNLRVALRRGLVVFTVDYAVKRQNIARAMSLSRQYGFVPFVGERALDTVPR